MFLRVLPSARIANGLAHVQHIRNMSVIATKLVYSEFGEPADVIKKVQEPLPVIRPNEVLVKILAAPINPADINTIQGRYPIKPALPTTAGHECVGEILQVGDKVAKLSKGDHVVPFQSTVGSWTSHAIFNEANLMKVPLELGILEACTINVNPPTAYRMLKDFVKLNPGDTVIQNGANSAVGQAVAQLCRAYNLNCIGVVRDRPNIDELKDFLKSLGTTEVLTEEEMRSTQLFKSGKFKKPRLGLNCVGGKSSTEMIRHLADKSVMVTYGGMSREPVNVSATALIFKDIAFKGYWMSRWAKENSTTPEREVMYNDLIQLMLEKKFVGPKAEEISIDNYKEAMENALKFQGFIGQKYVFKFDSFNN